MMGEISFATIAATAAVLEREGLLLPASETV